MLTWIPCGDEHVAVGEFRRHVISGKSGNFEIRTQRSGLPLFFEPVAARTGSLDHAKRIAEELEAAAAATAQPATKPGGER
jgi:hypothetical protein